MSHLNTKEEYLNFLEELNTLYKVKSKELITCTSLSKEMKIKDEMSKYEVQKKVIKRKLAAIESQNEMSA